VNTFIKRHLLLKMLFHCKKLSASAPLREIILFTLSASRTTATESAIQDNPKKPCDLPFSRRGAGAQSEHIHQETSSPKNALPLQKAQRLCASARDHSIYSVSFPNDRYRKCHSGQSKKTMRLAVFAQRRRGAETYSGRPFTQRVMSAFITSPPKLSQYPSLFPVSRR